MSNPEKDYSKPCTLCDKPRDVLVRCQIDESGQWHFVCPGSCWKRVSGGVIDGDGSEHHQFYRYGGMWKNKHDAVSAKKPKAGSKKKAPPSASPVSRSEGDTAHDEQIIDGEKPPMSGHESVTEIPGVPVWREDSTRYTKNDKVLYHSEIWICRKSHASVEGGRPPDMAQSLWKEQKGHIEDPD